LKISDFIERKKKKKRKHRKIPIVNKTNDTTFNQSFPLLGHEGKFSAIIFTEQNLVCENVKKTTPGGDLPPVGR
jgi:hypothetical protein